MLQSECDVAFAHWVGCMVSRTPMEDGIPRARGYWGRPTIRQASRSRPCSARLEASSSQHRPLPQPEVALSAWT